MFWSWIVNALDQACKADNFWRGLTWGLFGNPVIVFGMNFGDSDSTGWDGNINTDDIYNQNSYTYQPHYDYDLLNILLSPDISEDNNVSGNDTSVNLNELMGPPAPTPEQRSQAVYNTFVAIAYREFQKGFKEKNGDNMTSYGKWYGLNGQPWCAMFVSWSADQSGILGTIVPRYASVLLGKNWYIDNEKYKSRQSGYIPKAGDVIFFIKNGQRHTGIVSAYDVSIKTVYTIEGYSSNTISQRHYQLSDTYIEGYGVSGSTSYGINFKEFNEWNERWDTIKIQLKM
jgi:hypothetical protein